MSRHFFHSTLLTATLLLSIFALTTTTLAQDDDSIVLDTYGEPLKPGQNYYLVPTAYSDVGGGLTPVPVGSKSCPSTFYVSQVEDNTNFGDPIVISTRSNKVLLSNRIQISFAKFPPPYVLCRKYFPRVWGISEYNSTYVVEVNGDEGRGPFFTIEDAEDGNYLITICISWNKCGGLSFLNDVYDKPALGVNFTTPTSFVFEPNQFFSPRSVKSSRKQATM